jgi:hypothetical protein
MGFLVIVAALVLFGVGGGYVAYKRFGTPGLCGILAVVLIVMIAVWLFSTSGSKT